MIYLGHRTFQGGNCGFFAIVATVYMVRDVYHINLSKDCLRGRETREVKMRSTHIILYGLGEGTSVMYFTEA